jgi:hypothetical protein
MKRTLVAMIVGVMGIQGLTPVWASGPGTTAADILNIGVGARAIAMGEAYVAQADDVSSLYWNPGGLALMQQRQASFMYNDYLQDSSFQNAAIGLPLENGAIGGGVSYLSYGQIPGYGVSNQPIGDQSANTTVGTLGGAWLGNLWSLGFNGKFIEEKLADVSANTEAFDVGATAIYPKPVMGGTLRFGAVYQNLGPGVKFLDQTDPLPSTWKIGAAAVQMLDRKLNLSLDIGKPKDVDTTVQGGAEYWVNQYIALRAGYAATHTEGSGARTGVGLRFKGIDFNYAYAGYGELGMSNRFEISFKFGEPRPILTPEERKILSEAKAAMRDGRYDRAVLLFDSLIEMEPNYKPARRLIKVAMAEMETQQREMLARQGKQYNAEANKAEVKPGLSDLEDLEQLLQLTTPKSAEVKPPTNGKVQEQQQ